MAQPPASLLAAAAMFQSLWPVAAGLLPLALLLRRPLPQVPPAAALRLASPHLPRPRLSPEAALARWSAGGTMATLAILTLALLLT